MPHRDRCPLCRGSSEKDMNHHYSEAFQADDGSASVPVGFAINVMINGPNDAAQIVNMPHSTTPVTMADKAFASIVRRLAHGFNVGQQAIPREDAQRIVDLCSRQGTNPWNCFASVTGDVFTGKDHMRRRGDCWNYIRKIAKGMAHAEAIKPKTHGQKARLSQRSA